MRETADGWVNIFGSSGFVKVRDGWLFDEGDNGSYDNIGITLYPCSFLTLNDSIKNLVIPKSGIASTGYQELVLPIKEIWSANYTHSYVESITINNDVINLISYGATKGLTNLENIYVSANNPYFCASGGVLFDKNKTLLHTYPQGKWGSEYSIPNSVTKIADYAFYNSKLKSIKIPDSVTIIGTDAFKNCTNLTICCNKNSAAHTYARQNNISFELLDEPVVTTPVVTTAVINTTTTQASTTSVMDSYGNLFYKSMDEDNDGFFDYVSIIDCDQSATEAEIPDEIDGLPVASIGDSAFKDCENLASIEIPDSVISIESRAFSNCTKLKSLVIPEGVVSINNGVFENCKSLAGIVIPKTVTSIGNSAFSDCSALTGVVIPESVASIDIKAFFGCTGLKTIKISNPECEIYKISSAISDTAVIYGYDNSTAQAYAEKYNRRFISLNALPDLNVSDAVRLRKWLVNSDVLSEDDFIKCDLNYDGKLNVFDWIILKRIVINK